MVIAPACQAGDRGFDPRHFRSSRSLSGAVFFVSAENRTTPAEPIPVKESGDQGRGRHRPVRREDEGTG